MAYNKFIKKDGTVFLDLTADTVTEADVASGKTFHKADGTLAIGTASDDAIDDYLDAINGEIVGEGDYIVTFIGADGVTLCTVPVYEGYNCEEPVASKVIPTPTKPSTDTYKYTFSGWSNTNGGAASASVLKDIRENKTVYAAFAETYNFIAQGYLEGSTAYSDVLWGLHPDYTMRFVGEGSLTGTYSSGDKHTDYASQVKTVIISEGIDCLYSSVVNGYSGFTALENIMLPSTLHSIMHGAFQKCTSLHSIIIPAKVTNIGGFAFSNAGLTSAVFETTTGWKNCESGDYATSTAVISSEGLANPTTAAQYLTSTYCNGTEWIRRNTL